MSLIKSESKKKNENCLALLLVLFEGNLLFEGGCVIGEADYLQLGHYGKETSY